MAEPTEPTAVPDVPPDGATVEIDGETWTCRRSQWGWNWEAPDGDAPGRRPRRTDGGPAWLALWRERELRRREQARTCEWKLYAAPEDDSTFETECGGLWEFATGGVTENEAVHCHRCGGRIVVVGGEGADVPEIGFGNPDAGPTALPEAGR